MIEILDSELGLHPEILPLNTSLRPGATTLKLRLRIDWEPAKADPVLRALEARLEETCPGFSRHQCRGPAEYHVRRFARERRLPMERPRATVEASLALAHLIEHVMIDAVAFVGRIPSVSGVTGALARRRATYDVFVECPNAATAALACEVGPTWVVALLAGGALPYDLRSLLETARALNDRRPEARGAAEIANAIQKAPDSISSCLEALERAGYACRESGGPEGNGSGRYRVC